MRIGYGFSAGRSKEKDDKYIVLAGKKIDWRVGLFSDSEYDRDVVALAAADSLIGARGLGSLKQCSAASFDLKNMTGIQARARMKTSQEGAPRTSTGRAVITKAGSL